MTAAYVAFDQEWYVLVRDNPELWDLINQLFKSNAINFNCRKYIGRTVNNMNYFIKSHDEHITWRQTGFIQNIR